MSVLLLLLNGYDSGLWVGLWVARLLLGPRKPLFPNVPTAGYRSCLNAPVWLPRSERFCGPTISIDYGSASV